MDWETPDNQNTKVFIDVVYPNTMSQKLPQNLKKKIPNLSI